MDFGLSEEQRLLKEAARKFLEAEHPTAVVRRMMEDPTGFHAGLWESYGEMGWTGLLVPDEHGGAGLGLTDMIVVAEEMGRVLASGPFVPTAVAAALLLGDAGGRLPAALLGRIASGEAVVSVALASPPDVGGQEAPGVTARPEGSDYVLDGVALFVPHAAEAQEILLAVDVTGPHGSPAVFAVTRSADGVALTPLQSIDATQRLHELRLDGVRVDGERRLELRSGQAARERALQGTMIARAAEAVGLSDRTLEFSVEYATERRQFGHPIGSYQAIQHKLVDMLVQLENARSLVYYAAWAFDDRNDEAPIAAAMAHSYARDAAWNITSEAIQVHGGIGFTWEHDLHLFHRRAMVLSVTDGTPAEERESIARAVIGS